MLRPYCESENGDDSVNDLISIPGSSSSGLATQTPSVFVENSSDVHIGPRLQYSGPVTVKQYITVDGKNAIKSSSDEFSQDIAKTGLQPLEVVIGNSMYFGHPDSWIEGSGL
jgi:hypothetical protein